MHLGYIQDNPSKGSGQGVRWDYCYNYDFSYCDTAGEVKYKKQKPIGPFSYDEPTDDLRDTYDPDSYIDQEHEF